MEAFNPYRAWLGVMSDAQPPNHYELLGLRLLRADPTEVAEAFRRQVSRLSAYLSGEHASTAQRILSELATAKVELLTPTTKRIYDAKLAAGKQSAPRPAASAGASPKLTGSVASDDLVASDDWLPPAADPTLASSFAPGATSAIPVMEEPASEPQTVAPMNQPLPPPNQPLPPAHQPAPIYGYQQPYGQAIPTAAAPYYGGQGPSALPIASAPYGIPMATIPMAAPAPILYAQAAQAYSSGQVYGPGQEYHTGMSAVAVADQEPYAPAVSAPADSVAARTRFRRQSSPAPIVGGALVAGVLIVAGGIYAVKSDLGPVAENSSTKDASQEGPKKDGGNSPASATKPIRQREPGDRTEPDQPSKPPLSGQPWSTHVDADKIEQPDPASKAGPGMSDPEVPDLAVAGPKTSDPAKSRSTDPEPAKPDPTNPEMPAKPEPGEPPTAPEVTPKEEAAVKRAKKALAAARAALGKRDLEAAQQQLDQAVVDATPELEAEVVQVELLQKYIELFWKAVGETLPTLKVAEEFTVNSTVWSVVEGRADLLIMRKPGRNKEYALHEIPTPLAVILAQRSLDKAHKQTPAVIGAFLLADPNGDDQEARRQLEQAAAMGADVAPLLKVLEKPKP
ncbi:MAG TPA: hypothetical protein VND64_08410 [Pirellulales bacterium]|nr:hypothetical protein [Pirellulales bacterium]